MPPSHVITDEPNGEASWNAFYRRWRRLRPPLRPNAEVCSLMRTLIDAHRSRVLLLGATPELSDLASSTVAVDWSRTAVTRIWAGNTPGRRAVQGNWLTLPCADRSFSAAVGDGSLSCLEYPTDYRRFLQELSRVVQPGGRVLIRLFITPEGCESLGGVAAAAMAGTVGSIHALKWRLAHALCAERADANVPVQAILAAFEHLFQNRAALQRVTGWTTEEIDQIDAYRTLADVFSFPTVQQVLSILPPRFVRPRLLTSGTYELAERCPVLVAEVRG